MCTNWNQQLPANFVWFFFIHFRPLDLCVANFMIILISLHLFTNFRIYKFRWGKTLLWKITWHDKYAAYKLWFTFRFRILWWSTPILSMRMYDVCVSEGCKGMETLLSKLNTVPIHNWIMCTLEWLRHFHALFFPKYKKKPFAAEPLAK